MKVVLMLEALGEVWLRCAGPLFVPAVAVALMRKEQDGFPFISRSRRPASCTYSAIGNINKRRSALPIHCIDAIQS